MVVTYDIKLFRKQADRRNGILMSLLLLVAETKSDVSSANILHKGKLNNRLFGVTRAHVNFVQHIIFFFFFTFSCAKLFYLLIYLQLYLFPFYFFLNLLITSILGNQQKLYCLLFFHYDETRATMCKSILKIWSVFTFFSGIPYETLLSRGLSEMKQKIFLFNSMLIYFLLFNR